MVVVGGAYESVQGVYGCDSRQSCHCEYVFSQAQRRAGLSAPTGSVNNERSSIENPAQSQPDKITGEFNQGSGGYFLYTRGNGRNYLMSIMLMGGVHLTHDTRTK